jgi:GH24 family phage-related lysozyme (muramidase)
LAQPIKRPVHVCWITIGNGYDIGGRTSAVAQKELLAAGIPAPTAAALSAGAGLKGNSARTFIANSRAAMSITAAQAETLFQNEAHEHAKGVLRAIKVPLNQNQFDALVSLHYNVPKAFHSKSGTIAGLINAGKMKDAAAVFDKYVYGRFLDRKTKKQVPIVLPGLVKRRAAEKALFLSP